MNHRFTVEANPAGGFYVVERITDSRGDEWVIPRGWTYPTREHAEAALPSVASGERYPAAELIDSLVES